MQKVIQKKWLNIKIEYLRKLNIIGHRLTLGKTLMVLVGVMLIAMVSVDVLAAGHDLLAGTDSDLMATLRGSGRRYLYLAEGITGIAAFMKTKNYLLLGGIVVVAVAFNVLLAMYANV